MKKEADAFENWKPPEGRFWKNQGTIPCSFPVPCAFKEETSLKKEADAFENWKPPEGRFWNKDLYNNRVIFNPYTTAAD
ncbi:hypothetical protein MSLAZ_2750 [Methanosarcina lacustris Z-7289]|uniref:Uncharacterized protein n=1 Tax=Methanosarcina lacustris Z-7289 TaxID=1434111 RepID=A0A0E3S6A9_9EURY|nr:hypothetical protein [Methanosarcina lacustris]AKB76011.1 hypothetical protein MSLAZ_2750 [Methanosarcina lacustris Z-7289]